MSIQIAARPLSLQVRSYQPYASAYGPASASPVASSSAYRSDLLTLERKPAPDPGDIPPPEAPGSFWNRGEVRIGLMMAGSATVGGAAGYLASKAAGASLAWGTGIGAAVGVVLPLAMVVWALKNWN